MFEVIKNLPIPSRGRRGRNMEYTYPWDKLEVGDAFHVPLELARTVICASSNHAKKYKRRYVTRRIEDRIYIWRVQ